MNNACFRWKTRIKVKRSSQNNEVNLNEEVAVTLISHDPNPEGKEKTRRLFTTINRYAKPVSLGESILLDEDDLSSIISRAIINEHPIISYDKKIALNKTADLKFPVDNKKFSSTICLWRINEILIDPKQVYPKFKGPQNNLVRIRPSDKIIKEYKDKIFTHWDRFFEIFPKSKEFIYSDSDNFRKEQADYFFLRPIGQQVFFRVLKRLKGNQGLLQKIKLLNRI